MSDLLIPIILGAPAVLTAVMYVAKRLAAFDLELRTHREEARLRHLRASNHIWMCSQHEPTSTWLESSHAEFHQALISAWEEFDSHRGDAAAAEAFRAGQRAFLEAAGIRWGSQTEGAAGRLLRITKRLLRATTQPEDSRAWSTADSRTPRVSTEVPVWALALIGGEEAKRCAQEWAAHLQQRVEEGEIHEALVDRRQLARHAVITAIMRRLRIAHARLRRRMPNP